MRMLSVFGMRALGWLEGALCPPKPMAHLPPSWEIATSVPALDLWWSSAWCVMVNWNHIFSLMCWAENQYFMDCFVSHAVVLAAEMATWISSGGFIASAYCNSCCWQVGAFGLCVETGIQFISMSGGRTDTEPKCECAEGKFERALVP